MGKAWEHLPCDVDASWTWGGAMPTNKFVHNKSENEFFLLF